MALRQYKIVLCGDANTGKSSYVRRICVGDFERRYVPTLGVAVTSRLFHTSDGPVQLEFWDTAGTEKYGGLREGYYLGADALMVFMPSEDPTTAVRWIREARQVVTTPCPTALCLGKADTEDTRNVAITAISARCNRGLEEPLLQIVRKLTGRPHLAFVESPPMTLPTVTL